MADSTTNLDTISQSASQKEPQVNALADALSPASVYGRRASTSSALTWGFYGGKVLVAGVVTSIANGTLAVDASDSSGSTRYVEADPSDGSVSVNNSGFTAGFVQLYELTVGSSSVLSYVDKRTAAVAFLNANVGSVAAVIQAAASDETTALTTGTAKLTFRMPHAMTLTAVRASLSTASSSGAVTVGINEGGSTILSTDLTIDQGEKTSTTAATPAVISDAALADDAEITIDIDGAGTGAKGLKVTLIGTR